MISSTFIGFFYGLSSLQPLRETLTNGSVSYTIEIETVSTAAKKGGDGRDFKPHPMIRVIDLSKPTRRAMDCERFLDGRGDGRRNERFIALMDRLRAYARLRNEWQTTDSLWDIPC